MKRFLDDDFLLDGRCDRPLCEVGAAAADHRLSLPPAPDADRRQSPVWYADGALAPGDHYKWRAMRANGVPERRSPATRPTGRSSGLGGDRPRYAAQPALPLDAPRAELSLRRHSQLLGPGTARAIYDHCNRRLAEDGFTAQGLLAQYGVVVVCTTDDPVRQSRAPSPSRAHPRAATRLLPTWRPDQALALHDLAHWNRWVDRLEAASTRPSAARAFLEALGERHAFFNQTAAARPTMGWIRCSRRLQPARCRGAVREGARVRRPFAR